MPINNELSFDILRAGIVILNERNDRPGTLGVIATADGTDRWIVSCYHVLCRANDDPFSDGELIVQGRARALGRPVARVSAARADRAVDCAAALIDHGIPVSEQILGVPFVAGPGAPVKGMRVIKSGATTGVTERVIWRVSGDTVEIRAPEGVGAGFEISGYGDSGSLWIDADTLAPVAMHFGMRPTATSTALARPIKQVLATLRLRIPT